MHAGFGEGRAETYRRKPVKAPRAYSTDRGVSGHLAVVVAEEPTEAFSADDRSGPVEVGARHDELAAQALMVPILVIVLQVLADSGA